MSHTLDISRQSTKGISYQPTSHNRRHYNILQSYHATSACFEDGICGSISCTAVRPSTIEPPREPLLVNTSMPPSYHATSACFEDGVFGSISCAAVRPSTIVSPRETPRDHKRVAITPCISQIFTWVYTPNLNPNPILQVFTCVYAFRVSVYF